MRTMNKRTAQRLSAVATLKICRRFAGAGYLALILLSACHPSEPAAPTSNESATKTTSAAAGVTLKPDEVATLGIVTTAATAATFTAEVAGYGVVLSHDVIAQAVADVASAEAAVRQSRAALARVQRLANTPGAFPVENQESAERQAAADAAALALAQRRLSASFGLNSPWSNHNASTVLNELAAGQIKLVHATFPLGALGKITPHTLRIAHLDPNSPQESWQVTTVWDAPADASVPGRSFFAVLKDSTVGEGERVQIWVPTGAAETGVAIPAAAVVINEGNYWCYLEKPAGTYTRVAIDPGKPLADGYFVTQNVAVGDAIVTQAAGLLLARETNSGTEAE